MPALCPAYKNLNSPCVRHVPSVLSPPCDLHVYAMCRPTPFLAACVRHVSAICPPCVCNVSAMCPLFVGASPLCVRSSLGLASGLCPLLASCGAEPWHHQVKLFLTIAQPAAFILHARWSIFWAFISVPQIWPLQAHPVLQKLFGVYAGIIPQTVYCGVLS